MSDLLHISYYLVFVSIVIFTYLQLMKSKNHKNLYNHHFVRKKAVNISEHKKPKSLRSGQKFKRVEKKWVRNKTQVKKPLTSALSYRKPESYKVKEMAEQNKKHKNNWHSAIKFSEIIKPRYF